MTSKAFLLLSLLLQLLASACCEKCPAAEDIYPCKCLYDEDRKVEIQCRSCSLMDVAEAFDHFRGKTIEHMDISDATGDRLPSQLFRNMCVRILTIFDCDFKDLSDSDGKPAFLGLENCLESLNVFRSIKGDNLLKTLDLSYLKCLQHVQLYENNVPEVGNDWFAESPDSLVAIDIKRSWLTKFGDTAFAPVKRIASLDLTGNGLATIKRSMIANPAPQLEDLALENNNLTRLPNDIFSGMPSLVNVYLSGNLIRRIEETTWSSVWESLGHLHLYDNPLECDSHMEWMFSLRQPETLWGTCDSPPTQKGVELSRFIESNRKL